MSFSPKSKWAQAVDGPATKLTERFVTSLAAVIDDVQMTDGEIAIEMCQGCVVKVTTANVDRFELLSASSDSGSAAASSASCLQAYRPRKANELVKLNMNHSLRGCRVRFGAIRIRVAGGEIDKLFVTRSMRWPVEMPDLAHVLFQDPYTPADSSDSGGARNV